ncbi:asparagine synthase-related protein [Paenibacillus tarimensis]|uniref:asparagine synthase-related protein n=1 Tax=Paenibacillus tarimensis TaxID=416012 RepID=UPI001F39688A|nr:asparagine synthase-related protein [Paenibacillus tarimensis]MCF2944246.1 asparagine synthase-related protein [Paenibacillus tarimensis]
MSAIAGILKQNSHPVTAEERSSLLESLAVYKHDRLDSLHAGSLFLGSALRCITPESVDEQLPRRHPSLRLTIVSDAILDNREELAVLLQLDTAEAGNLPDSEYILLAYNKWGSRTPEFLLGDYAFVIWDETEHQLFAARDPLGNRTLYYTYDSGDFAFCSAIAPLLSLPGRAKQLNHSWFAEFLAIPMMLDSTEVGSTAYKGILQLPPSSTLVLKNSKLITHAYDSNLIPHEPILYKSNADYEEAFRHVFDDAVKTRLRTHRRVAATLSGGLDSGAVVGFAANPLRAAGKKLYTYSYVPATDFTQWKSRSRLADESPYIRATVQHVGNIEPGYHAFDAMSSYSELDEWLSILESPYKFFENSFWIKGIYEEAARHDTGILLTGARGNNTISCGSALDYYILLVRRARLLTFYRELRSYSRVMGVGRKKILSIISRNAISTPYASKHNDFPLLIHPDFAEQTNVIEKLREKDVGLTASRRDGFEERRYYFRSPALLNMQATSSAKLLMRYGIAERDPTADVRVIRFCMSIPLDQYVQNGMDRALVRRITKGYLPDQVRLNQRVRGVQGADWLHRVASSWDRVRSELEQLCQDSAASSLMNTEQIKIYLSQANEPGKVESAFRDEYRYLMKCLIAYRFLKQFTA